MEQTTSRTARTVLVVVGLCLLAAQCTALTCSQLTNQTNLGGSCVLYQDCGWCNATRECMNGTATGPLHGVCPSQDGNTTWEWVRCAQVHHDCVTCNSDPSCGWCHDTCQPRVFGKDGTSGPKFPCLGWVPNKCNCYSNSNQWPPPTDMKACGACTNAFGGSECAYCLDTDQCAEVTDIEATCGTDDYSLTPSECSCAAYDSCYNCIERSNLNPVLKGTCSWCASSGTCQAQSQTHLCSATWANIDHCCFFKSNDAGACLADPHCGECSHGGANIGCLNGNSSGAFAPNNCSGASSWKWLPPPTSSSTSTGDTINPSESSSGGGMSKGMVALVVVGALSAASVAACGVWYAITRVRSNKQASFSRLPS